MALAAIGFAAPDNSQTAGNQHSSNRADMQNSKAKLSRQVGELLNSTNQARKAIADKNQQQATKDVDEALNGANSLMSQRGASDLVPLYTELVRTSVITPIMQQRRTATAQARGRQSGSADRTAPGKKNDDEVVREVVGDYTTVLLDVPATQIHLRAAQKALANHDLAAADRDLKAVQDSLVVTSLDADMPLLRARENLVLARDSAVAGNYRDAQDQLRAASRALSTYVSANSSHKQDAQRLQSEISNYAQSIEGNHSDASSKIESWWEQTTNWMTPTTAQSNSTAMRKTPTR
jgi:hypothetical protein